MTLVFPYPPISTSTAHALTFLFAFSYVGSLYISKNARLSFTSKPRPPANGNPRDKTTQERWRDDPDVIQARLLAVTTATIICCAGVFGMLWYFMGDAPDSLAAALNATAERLGFNTHLDLDSIYPHLVTPVLFLGPLYAKWLGNTLPFQQRWSLETDVINKFITWQGARNFFMAPITEEIVFRACVLAVYHLSGASTKRMIFLGPLAFGMAHVHHAWDTFNRYGRNANAAKRAIITTLVQLSYTTLFGFHCSYLFLRTGSIFPPISAHIFCNIMGLPEISWELKKFPKRKNSILLAYALGIFGFGFLLSPWTLTPGGLYWRNTQEIVGKGSY